MRHALLLLLLSACHRERPGDDATGPKAEARCAQSALCDGDIRVSTQAELGTAAQCREVSGQLDINGLAWLTRLDLPCLVSVGDLHIERNPALVAVALPALASVSHQLVINDNQVLLSLVAPSLASVGKALFIQAHPNLGSIAMPSLVTVGDQLDIFQNQALVRIDLPVLASVADWLYILDNDALRVLDGMPALRLAGAGLGVYGNASLCQVDALTFAHTFFVDGDSRVEDNGSGRSDCD